MEIIEFKENIVCYNSINYYNNKNLKHFIDSIAYESILKQIGIKVIMVLGGDGAMLKAIKNYNNLGFPFLGINFGRKGFLLNSKDYIKEKFTYIERTYPLLEIENEVKGIKKIEYAMNEVDIRAGVGKMIGLELELSKNQKIGIEGDGLIISTPAGSTGYNSSLGGPLIPHTLEALIITPKAPWKPKLQSSIIINDKETIYIKNTGRKSQVEIYIDGRLFMSTVKDTDLRLKIKKSLKSIRLIIAKEYVDIWDNKVLHEQGFIV